MYDKVINTMNNIIEIFDYINTFENQCFSIKRGPLKTIERAFIKYVVDLFDNNIFGLFENINFIVISK